MHMARDWKLWGTMVLLAALLLGAVRMGRAPVEPMLLGGGLHEQTVTTTDDVSYAVFDTAEGQETWARFRRPSSAPALAMQYDGDELLAVYESGQTVSYTKPEEVIHGYLALLGQAANLEGYSAGCGSVGAGTTPYPYAWSLLTEEAKAKLSLDDFLDSFAGVGALTPLALEPLKVEEDEAVFWVELEYIQAGRQSTKPQPTAFCYCYGLIVVRHTARDGWRIQATDYLPEDFLCAPEHGWAWEAQSFVSLLYGDQYGLIDGVDLVDRQNKRTTIFASGGGRAYRFDFLRTTDGIDRLVGEWIQHNGDWQETSLLRGDDRIWKLTPDSPAFAR